MINKISERAGHNQHVHDVSTQKKMCLLNCVRVSLFKPLHLNGIFLDDITRTFRVTSKEIMKTFS